MIHADHINNTALYCFHPDFVRHENDETPVHEEDSNWEYAFNRLDAYWTGVFLVIIGLLAAWMIAVPLIRHFKN
jgi:hypothetical protein